MCVSCLLGFSLDVAQLVVSAACALQKARPRAHREARAHKTQSRGQRASGSGRKDQYSRTGK